MLTFSRIKKPAKPPSFASSVKEYFRRLPSVKQTRPAFVVVRSNEILSSRFVRPGCHFRAKWGARAPHLVRSLGLSQSPPSKGKAPLPVTPLGGWAWSYPLCSLARHITIIPIAAAAITAAVNQPSQRNNGLLILSSITARSLVSIVTNTTRGGARTPLSTAAQNNILTGLSPRKSRPSPITTAAARTP